LLFFDEARTQPLTDPYDCADEFRTARRVLKKGVAWRKHVQNSCNDTLLGSLSACATTVDGLVNPTGDGGCLIEGHAAAVEAMIEAQY